MRLDPNAMHWPIYSAGLLLARLGRQEVYNCIDGLNQNGYAYDGNLSCPPHFSLLEILGTPDRNIYSTEAWTHAKQLQNMYTEYSAHGPMDENALVHNYVTGGVNGGQSLEPPSTSSGRRPQSTLSPVVRPTLPPSVRTHPFYVMN